MSTFRINLHEVVFSLSDALDLVGVTHIHHGKRVAYMATEIGQRLGWSQTVLDDLFQAAILHDCGVSKTTVHSRLTQLEWEHEFDHCIKGAALVSSSALLKKHQESILYHHTHWPALDSADLPLEIKLCANCIYLADRVDVLTLSSLQEQSDVLLGIENTKKTILERKHEWFQGDLVEAFLDIADDEVFWLKLDGNRVNGYATDWLKRGHYQDIDFNELRDLVHIFSVIVDTKSSFTREHSDGVANLARHIGNLFQLPERNCEMLELAGLLHDLGKLRVPDELLEKPGKLTAEEYLIVERHSFDTFQVLKTIKGMRDIAFWAGQHHERADGKNRRYQIRISLEAKIVAVADVFQALAQNRPYRQALTPEQILAILSKMASEGKLDQNVVGIVSDNLQSCWQAALV